MTPRQAFWAYIRVMWRHHGLRQAGAKDDEPRLITLVDTADILWARMDATHQGAARRFAERLDRREVAA